LLPIDDILPDLLDALRHSRNAVLSAPPGAGKTTRVPPALIQEPGLLAGKVILLEPRRLAAARAAGYMAARLGQRAGDTVGYRIRGETLVGPSTRIEVVTEGVLTRMLRQTPDLPGVSLIIFDEFHERSIHADLGLALSLDVQAHLREDLRILIMSATLEGSAVAQLIGGAPVLESSGQSYPVVTRYLPSRTDEPLPSLVVRTIDAAVRDDEGDILVFLPGQREIHRVASLLADAALPQDVRIQMLFGDAPAAAQDAALEPAPPGFRKVILATSIAETSLTIDGVRVVIDAGLARSSRFDPRRGMSALMTGPVSRAAADQRRGRAGRQSPGVCYRLWTEDHHRSLRQYAPPEILVTDLARLALDLAAWGSPDGAGLQFLDPPPSANLAQARALLKQLTAVNDRGFVTDHGRAMSELPVHPRLSHMILRGKQLGIGVAACRLAALLEERDPLRSEKGADIDLASRWNILYGDGARQRQTMSRHLRESRRLMKLAGIGEEATAEASLGLLTALAYPDRIARRRGTDTGRYLMSGGTGAVVPDSSLLAREEFLSIADLDGASTEARVYLATPLSYSDLIDHFSNSMEVREEVYWSERDEAVVGRTVRVLGSLVISEGPMVPSGDRLRASLLLGIRSLGSSCLPWGREVESLRSRSEWLRTLPASTCGWPDLSDAVLMDTLEIWLVPFLGGVTGTTTMHRIPLLRALRGLFTHSQLTDLERLAPPAWSTPAGSRILLKYMPGTGPVAAVKLQEMFGQTDTPQVAGGRARITVHLLSPAGRPLAITQDLRSFWLNVYPEVRKEMRGRYPKHIWPEDPLSVAPTRRTVKRNART
jgi:ATP-dependent helicase HrpB